MEGQKVNRFGSYSLLLQQREDIAFTNHKKKDALCTIPPSVYSTAPTMMAIFLPKKSEKATEVQGTVYYCVPYLGRSLTYGNTARITLK